MNQVLLRGVVAEPAVFSHQTYRARLYRLELDAVRLSGTGDRLRVLVSEEALRALDPCVGDALEVAGQMRSYNNKTGQGSRLMISVLARRMERCDTQAANRVLLSGAVCKPPVFRRTPLGREICDIMLAVPRIYNRSDYLPLIAWGQIARLCAQLAVGDPLYIEGRFQSRGYAKLENGITREKTAYEVSVVKVLGSEEELESISL